MERQTCFAASAAVGAVAARGGFTGCALRKPVRHAVAARRARVAMQLSSPAIGRPKTQIKKDIGRVTKTAEPEPEADKGSAKARPRRKTLADEIPMFKVILLADEGYDEAHVVTQLQKTVQLDKKNAQRVFHEAQSTGSSVACVVCEEHAEFYAQQLLRQDIFVTVEKDE